MATPEKLPAMTVTIDSLRANAEKIQAARYDYRSSQLEKLITKFGSAKKLAAAIGMSRCYVTSLRSMDIGESAARTIEQTLGLKGHFALNDITAEHVQHMTKPYRKALQGLEGRILEQEFYRLRIQDMAEEYPTAMQFGNAIGFTNGHYISLMLGRFRPVSEFTRTVIELMPGHTNWFSPEAAYTSPARLKQSKQGTLKVSRAGGSR